MVDVCYVISHGFAARMVMQTQLLSKLVDQGLKVAIITPDSHDQQLREACEKNEIQLFEFKADTDLFTLDYQFKRKYYLEDNLKENPTLWSKHLQAISRSHSSRIIFPILARLYYLVNRINKINPFLRKLFLRRERRFLKSKKATALLEKINCKLLVATYPMNLPESILLFNSKQLNISTAIHLLSWDNVTAKGIFPVLTDKYIVWGPIMKKEIIAYYNVSEKNIYPCGVPHFDQHIIVKKNKAPNNYLELLNIDPHKPYIFLAMSAPYFAPNAMEIIERIADWVNDSVFGDDMQFIVRPHPQNVESKMANFSWLPRLKALNSSRVAVDFPTLNKSNLPWSMDKSDMVRLSTLIDNSQLVINFGSTIAIDALVLEKPVITIAFDGDKFYPWHESCRRQVDFTHFKKLVDNGGGLVAFSYDDLKNQIIKYTKDPAYKKQERDYAMQQECLSNDGNSTQRVVEALMVIHKNLN